MNLVGVADKADLVLVPRFQFCHTNQDVLILVAVAVVQSLRLHEKPELIAVRALVDPSTTLGLLVLGRSGHSGVSLPSPSLLLRRTAQTAAVVRTFPRCDTPAFSIFAFLSSLAVVAASPPK